VTVAHPVQREVIEWDEYTGWLEPVESVDVSARVSGFIEEAPFQEGAIINKGDLLYVIDSRLFQANLDKAESEAVRADAQRAFAANEFKRVESLRPSNAASELELENARQLLREAEANVNAAKAQVEADKLNVEWCRVIAPISGRIGRKLVTPGNLINGGAGDVTILTTIASIDPIYSYLEVDEQSVLKYQRLSREDKRVSARDTQIPIFLGLSNEDGKFPHEGVVDFVDNRINPETGTLRGRGVFPNPTGYLTPGMFARLRIPGSGRYTAILIPDSAIGMDQNQRFVLTVTDDGTVHHKPVKLGALFGQYRSIEEGVLPEDRIIINGIQRARPGTKVSPELQAISTDDVPLVAPGSAATQELPVRGSTAAPTTAPDTDGGRE
jgi:RND family efflux transporter MFP subunit